MLLTARNNKGIGRDRAAEQLFVGSKTLQDYEKGNTQAPPGVYLRAAGLYNNPELTAHCCKHHCEIGEKYCYDIKKKPVAIAALQIIRAYRQLTPELIDELIHVAEDNVITVEEQPLIEKITEVLMRFEKPTEEWKLAVAEAIDVPKLTEKVSKNETTPPPQQRVV